MWIVLGTDRLCNFPAYPDQATSEVFSIYYTLSPWKLNDKVIIAPAQMKVYVVNYP